MKIDPLLIRAFSLALIYGVGAFAYFNFFGGAELSVSDAAVRSAATAGIFLLLYYVLARTFRGRT